MIFLAGLGMAVVMCFIAVDFWIGFKVFDYIDDRAYAPWPFLGYFFTVFAWLGLTAQLLYWTVSYYYS